MKVARVKVHIPRPCSENWDDMLPAEQGRFSLSCRKTVVDFTQMSDAEIQEIFTRNPVSCGRFYKEQVLQSYELPRTFFQKWKDFLAAAWLVIGTQLTVLSPALAQTTALNPKASVSQNAVQQPEPIGTPDGNIYLKGTLRAIEDAKPLAEAKVTVQVVNYRDSQTRFHYGHTENSPYANSAFQTVTDSAGKFELAVPVVELGNNDYIVNFNFAGNNSYLPLEAFQAWHSVEQYLARTSINRTTVNSRRETSRCMMPFNSVRELVVPDLPGTPKFYKTRAGVVLSRAARPFRWVVYPVRLITYPYRWVKIRIKERSYYD